MEQLQNMYTASVCMVHAYLNAVFPTNYKWVSNDQAPVHYDEENNDSRITHLSFPTDAMFCATDVCFLLSICTLRYKNRL